MQAKNAVRWVTYGALFLIPFLPLLVTNSFFFPFITGKNFAFRILVEIALGGWIALMCMDTKYRPRFSWTSALFGLFVVWMAIADCFAVNPAKAFWSNFERMDGWVTLIHVFALFLITSSIFAADALWRKWWYVFLGVAAVVCCHSLLQAICTGQSCAATFPIHQGSTRVDANFGNSAYLAAYLLFTTAISAWLAFTSSKKWMKWVLGVFIAIQIIIVFLTETRGAILGLIGAIALSAFLWALTAGKRGRNISFGILGAIVVLVLLFFAVRTTPIVKDIPGVDRLASISTSDSESVTRLTIWHMALEGAAQKPITGWGQEGFNYVFNQYYEPSLYAQEPWFDRAHDIFLDWLVAGGVPAFGLFVALMATALVSIYRNQNVSRIERLMLISAIAAYLFQGLFIFDNLFTYVPLAVVLAMINAHTSRPIAKLAPPKWPTLNESGSWIAAVTALICVIIVVWAVNVPNIRAASDLIVAITPGQDPTAVIAGFKQAYADNSFADQEISEQLMTYATSLVSNTQVSDSDKEMVFTYALTQMQATVNKIPKDARLRLEYAVGLRAAGQYADALQQIQTALQLSPNKQGIIIEEGIEYWQSGNTGAAAQAFNHAYALDPSFSTIVPYTAAGDIVTGNVAGGKTLLQQAFGTTTVDQQVLMLAYYDIKDYPDLIALLQQQVVDTSDSDNAEFELAAAYANAGDYAQARAEVQLVIAQHPEDASEAAQFLTQIPTGK